MRKLLASDLDGTLLKNNELLEENRKAVKELVDKNNKFIVSTGRPYNGVEFLHSEKGMNIDYYVLLNGALILDGEKNVIDHKIIDFSIVEEIIGKYVFKDTKIALENGYSTFLLYETNDECAYLGKVLVDDIEVVRKEEISLISLYYPNNSIEEIDGISKEITKLYEGKVIAYRNTKFIDIVPVGCSKGNGVKVIVENEGIDMDKVYTIGDSWNDVSMFEVTENSFTFNEVEEDLKGHANYLVDSVAECIREYMI